MLIKKYIVSFSEIGKMKFLSIITTILTLGLSLTGITFLQKREIKAISLDSGNSPELQEKLDGVVLKIQDQMPTLGFDNLLADWNYLNFIQYFGDRQAREITGYTLSPFFLK